MPNPNSSPGLAALRTPLDHTYGNFNQPFGADTAAGVLDIDGLLRDFMFARWQPHLPPTPVADIALAIGLQHERDVPLMARHYLAPVILNPAGRIVELLLQDEALLSNANLAFGAPEQLGDYAPCAAIFSIHTFNFFERPEAVLAAAYQALQSGGKLFIGVQNPTTGTRELALTMGFISSLHEIPAALRQAGQVRFFDLSSLRATVGAAGFTIVDSGGVMLKTLTDAQITALMRQGLVGEPYLRALDKLGQRLPELCSSIYVVAQKA